MNGKIKPTKLGELSAPDIIEPPQAVTHLSRAIQFVTVSESRHYDQSQFEAFINYVSEQYPLIGTKLRRQTIGTNSLLYQWAGKAE